MGQFCEAPAAEGGQGPRFDGRRRRTDHQEDLAQPARNKSLQIQLSYDYDDPHL